MRAPLSLGFGEATKLRGEDGILKRRELGHHGVAFGHVANARTDREGVSAYFLTEDFHGTRVVFHEPQARS